MNERHQVAIIGSGPSGLLLGQLIMARTALPYMLQTNEISSAMLLLVIAGMLGGALAIRRVTSVDPIIALGQEQ